MGEPFAEKYGPWALLGGACQGIGRAFADALAERGLKVVLADVRADLLPGVASELRARFGAEVETLALDLGDRAAGARLSALAQEREIGLGIACAAIGGVGPFLSEPLDAHRARIDVNCGGALSIAYALAGPMVARKRGGLVLVSSMAGMQGTGWVASYSATKAYDLALAEGLWFELAPHGVDVLALVPGNTDTPGLRSSSPKKGQKSWMQPAEVAREALEALGREPFHVCGEANRKVVEALTRLPRAERVRIMGEQHARSLRRLNEEPHHAHRALRTPRHRVPHLRLHATAATSSPPCRRPAASACSAPSASRPSSSRSSSSGSTSTSATSRTASTSSSRASTRAWARWTRRSSRRRCAT